MISGKNTAQRRDFVVAARIPTASGTLPTTFTPIGTRVPDASLSFNQGVEIEVDIFENTYVTLGAPSPTMDFEGVVNNVEYDVHALMLNSFIDGDTNKVAGIECILIFGYDGAVGTYTAVRKSDCLFQLTDLGGAGESARTNQTFTIHFGGISTRGTVDSIAAGAPVTFNPAP